jgi:hypothetical protein
VSPKLGQKVQFVGDIQNLLSGISNAEVEYLLPTLSGNSWRVTDLQPDIPEMSHLIEIGRKFGKGVSHFFYVSVDELELITD